MKNKINLFEDALMSENRQLYKYVIKNKLYNDDDIVGAIIRLNEDSHEFLFLGNEDPRMHGYRGIEFRKRVLEDFDLCKSLLKNKSLVPATELKNIWYLTSLVGYEAEKVFLNDFSQVLNDRLFSNGLDVKKIFILNEIVDEFEKNDVKLKIDGFNVLNKFIEFIENDVFIKKENYINSMVEAGVFDKEKKSVFNILTDKNNISFFKKAWGIDMANDKEKILITMLSILCKESEVKKQMKI